MKFCTSLTPPHSPLGTVSLFMHYGLIPGFVCFTFGGKAWYQVTRPKKKEKRNLEKIMTRSLLTAGTVSQSVAHHSYLPPLISAWHGKKADAPIRAGSEASRRKRERFCQLRGRGYLRPVVIMNCERSVLMTDRGSRTRTLAHERTHEGASLWSGDRMVQLPAFPSPCLPLLPHLSPTHIKQRHALASLPSHGCPLSPRSDP